MSNKLEKFKNLKFSGVRELAEAARTALEFAGTSQDRATVKEYPSERAVRYYITEGLLDQALERSGVKSVFGYEHLITLLTIKKLQSDGLPINVIRTLITGKSVEELEKLFGEEIRVFTRRDDLEAYRKSIGHFDDTEVLELDAPSFALADLEPEVRRNEAKDYLESLLLQGQGNKPRRFPNARSPLPPSAPATSDWRRYEIVTGVELHISRSFRPPMDEAFRQQMLVLIDGILQSRENRRR